MLAIRMQRTGRKGHAMFRVVVQDSRVTPTSGKVVALLGSYDPHAKTTTLDKEKAAAFLTNGAQPSERVVRLFQSEGVKLPSWVTVNADKAGKLRNPEKLRKNQPKEAAAPAEAEAPAEEAPAAEAENTEA
jgi:small subunit ribosomal protein S16